MQILISSGKILKTFKNLEVLSECYKRDSRSVEKAQVGIWYKLNERLRDVSRKNQFLPGTIRPGRFAQKIERDGSRKKTGTIRSKSNLEVDSPIFINILI